MTAFFVSSDRFCNVFCAELSVEAMRGHSEARCFKMALTRAASVLGVTEYNVARSIPKKGDFLGHVSVNGKKIPCKVSFFAEIAEYPKVAQL